MIKDIAQQSKFNMEKFESALEDQSYIDSYFEDLELFAQYSKLTVGHVLTNGRLLAIPEQSVFNSKDFEFLAQFEHTKRAQRVENIISSAQIIDVSAEDQTRYYSTLSVLTISSFFMSNIIMKAVSIVGKDEAEGIDKVSVPSNVIPYDFYNKLVN